ncbi:copper homeostasis [Fusarium albosuccineum]|uniref:Copper homeostasis protein cutC homolog n=1 Tax=Fusarium albosuccineum TaxID=1237068 RepID=A0A8H4P6A0_9HYPO|nr:copper homeostasis [Fusarium albosuccineum]
MPPLPTKFPKPIPLEVSVYGTENGIKAANFGAKRLLLNRKGSQAAGGLTPEVKELQDLKGKVHIPINCTIRPRGAPDKAYPGEDHDYIYSNNEFVQMCEAVHALKYAGVMNPIRGDSFVFGCVRRKHEAGSPEDHDRIVIDRAYCQYLVRLARPYGCTFNRAFDHFAANGEWPDIIAELKQLGFKGVMTAGGPGYFYPNVDTLSGMCHRLSDLQLVVAGGIFCREIQKLRKRVHDFNFHSIWMNGECLRPSDNEDPETTDVNGVMGLIDQLGLETEDWMSPYDIGKQYYY